MQQVLPVTLPPKSFQQRLQESPLIVFVLYVSLSSFVVYGCMYGFRKPFTAASYNGYRLFGISYKTILVISQVIGYVLSKFYGIRFIATMQPEKRALTILKLIGVAWVSLLLFALVPFPYNFVFMFINGLPLGMVWGLVFGFLEGRRFTELMGAVLATSFIFASGLAKTVGKWIVLQFPISEWQMPFAAGCIFIIPLLISVWLLKQTPPPTEEDKANRTLRKPMNATERKTFVKQFGLILIPVVIAYSLLTVLRDFCEDFANELWTETGFQNNAGIFAQTSTIISLVVLAVVGGFFIIRNNYKAFQLTHVLILFGFLLAGAATFLHQFHFISPWVWFVTATSGLYLGYVPYNCLYFERMLATFKVQGNVGFVMYIADAFGYLGTVFVLLLKEFVTIKYSWVHFFTLLFYVTAGMGIILIIWGVLASAKTFKKFHYPPSCPEMADN
jgi:MFS family permease